MEYNTEINDLLSQPENKDAVIHPVICRAVTDLPGIPPVL